MPKAFILGMWSVIYIESICMGRFCHLSYSNHGSCVALIYQILTILMS